MDNLSKDRLGKVLSVDKTMVFYKKLPCNVQDEALANYRVSPDDYKTKFVNNQ